MIRKIWIRSFVFLIASRNENESERMWQRDFPCDNWTVSFQRSLGYVFAYISILKVTSVARLREKKCMKERKKVSERLYIHRLHFVRILRSSLFSDLFVSFRRLIKWILHDLFNSMKRDHFNIINLPSFLYFKNSRLW